MGIYRVNRNKLPLGDSTEGEQMPTGYTAGVQDGTIEDFKTFLFRCARAFGALIEMRDDAMDAPIPESFAPSSYHTEALAKAKADLERFKAMTIQQAKRAAAAEYAAQIKEKRASDLRREAGRVRYEAMLAKAKEWVPPTKNHEGLKTFMVQQLTDSIRFDCSPLDWNIEQLDGDAWVVKKIKAAKHDIEYHSKHLAEDIERAEERTRWVKQLRGSVGMIPA